MDQARRAQRARLLRRRNDALGEPRIPAWTAKGQHGSDRSFAHEANTNLIAQPCPPPTTTTDTRSATTVAITANKTKPIDTATPISISSGHDSRNSQSSTNFTAPPPPDHAANMEEETSTAVHATTTTTSQSKRSDIKAASFDAKAQQTRTVMQRQIPLAAAAISKGHTGANRYNQQQRQQQQQHGKTPIGTAAAAAATNPPRPSVQHHKRTSESAAVVVHTNSTVAAEERCDDASTGIIHDLMDRHSSQAGTMRPRTGINGTAGAHAAAAAALEKRHTEPLKHRVFRTTFGVPFSERLIGDFSCSVGGTMMRRGRLFLSDNYICFYSSVLSALETCIVIPANSVTCVKATRVALFFPSGIVICTDTKSHFFTSFSARNDVMTLLKSILDASVFAKGSGSGGDGDRQSGSRGLSFPASPLTGSSHNKSADPLPQGGRDIPALEGRSAGFELGLMAQPRKKVAGGKHGTQTQPPHRISRRATLVAVPDALKDQLDFGDSRPPRMASLGTSAIDESHMDQLMDTELNISAEGFHALFLSNRAPCSIYAFRVWLGESDVATGKWVTLDSRQRQQQQRFNNKQAQQHQQQATNEGISVGDHATKDRLEGMEHVESSLAIPAVEMIRDSTYRTPLNFPIGPSSSTINVVESLVPCPSADCVRRFEWHACSASVGVPFARNFFVMEKWLIEDLPSPASSFSPSDNATLHSRRGKVHSTITASGSHVPFAKTMPEEEGNRVRSAVMHDAYTGRCRIRMWLGAHFVRQPWTMRPVIGIIQSSMKSDGQNQAQQWLSVAQQFLRTRESHLRRRVATLGEGASDSAGHYSALKSNSVAMIVEDVKLMGEGPILPRRSRSSLQGGSVGLYATRIQPSKWILNVIRGIWVYSIAWFPFIVALIAVVMVPHQTPMMLLQDVEVLFRLLLRNPVIIVMVTLSCYVILKLFVKAEVGAPHMDVMLRDALSDIQKQRDRIKQLEQKLLKLSST